ncbi:energy transducer TonB [Carboxylicivirga marina]|uniref:Energy transducer TonB n=1 Tax=Carboxylicivirga marina TaxID=2800988 RepID=A0ABS1HQP4_9BACT|nr:energy transducer TonB [Carboxylicivirga marina]MBK3519553.1 energy transducer TonB [Carboxylicivirga marina]
MKASHLLPSLIILLSCMSNTLVAQDVITDINVYTAVDKMPRLKGAGKDISQHIRKQVDYNDSFKLRGVEGDVWVSFVVTFYGEVMQVVVEKGIDSELDALVVEALKESSKWKPGELDKKKVNTKMRLPIRFILSNSERHMARQLKVLDEQDKRPLFILDDKLIEGLVQVHDYNVESIRIIKGEKAIKLYGDRAENGVVVITSKNGTNPHRF